MNLKLPEKKQLIVYGVFIVAGLVGGFLYWRYVGCRTGTCPLKSNPYYMIGVGGLFGYLIPDTIFSRKKKSTS